MSILGRLATRGDLVSIYRPVFGPATGGGGSRVVDSWTPVTVQAKALLEELTAARGRLLFGEADAVQIRAVMPAAYLVQPGDRMLVESGLLAGQRFQVDERHRFQRSAHTQHQEIALNSTDEVFP